MYNHTSSIKNTLIGYKSLNRSKSKAMKVNKIQIMKLVFSRNKHRRKKMFTIIKIVKRFATVPKYIKILYRILIIVYHFFLNLF